MVQIYLFSCRIDKIVLQELFFDAATQPGFGIDLAICIGILRLFIDRQF